MAKWLVCLFIVKLFCVSSASAQDISIFIAGINIKLGMSKSAVIGKFPRPYDLKQVEGRPNIYLIREQNTVANYNIVGMLWFKDDKLTRASKTWLNEAGDLKSSEFMDTLYSVLEQMEQRGETSPTIVLDTMKEPGNRIQRVNLHYRLRTIIIVVTDSTRFGKDVEISEEIGSIR